MYVFLKERHDNSTLQVALFLYYDFSTKTKNDLNKDKLVEEQSDNKLLLKIASEYDQEIPQSLTADNPMAPRGKATQQSRGTRKANLASNQLSLPPQDDCKTRLDIK